MGVSIIEPNLAGLGGIVFELRRGKKWLKITHSAARSSVLLNLAGRVTARLDNFIN